MFEQGGVPRKGRRGLGIEVVERSARPQALLDQEAWALEVDGDRVRRIGLQLDRMGAGLGCGVDQGEGPGQLSVVVSGQLGDDERRVFGSDGPAGDGKAW